MDDQVFLHRNGGGKILGALGGVGSDCLLSQDSRVEGRSFVSYHSSIISSAIKDSSISSAEISSSVIIDSHIAGAVVVESALENVIVRANGRKADIERVSLSDDVVVEGCKLRDLELSGPYLLHTNWNRAPRTHLLETETGIRIGISECGRDDRFHVGCSCRPWSEWDRKEDLLRKMFVVKSGWPLELFNSIRGIFAEWR